MSVWLYTIARLPDVTDVVVHAHPIIYGHRVSGLFFFALQKVYTLAAQELQKFLHIYYFVLIFLEIYPTN